MGRHISSRKMDFTLKILKAEKENQVFSPINIAHAFGLLLHGAGGETEKEIANILGYASAEECVKSVEACLSACNTDSIERAANLFLNQKFDLHEKYVASTNEKLGAKSQKLITQTRRPQQGSSMIGSVKRPTD